MTNVSALQLYNGTAWSIEHDITNVMAHTVLTVLQSEGVMSIFLPFMTFYLF